MIPNKPFELLLDESIETDIDYAIEKDHADRESEQMLLIEEDKNGN